MIGVLLVIGFYALIFILDKSSRPSGNKDKKIKIYESDLNKIKNENVAEKNELIESKKKYDTEKEKLQQKFDIEKKNFLENEAKLLQNKAESQKWLAGMLSDFYTITIQDNIKELNNSYSYTKHEHAIKLSELKLEIKKLIERNKMLEYELKYLYTLYPKLEDTEIELDDNNTKITPLENSGWLTKEEWENLSDLERNELAYKRYKNRHKTKWQIGRDFEMFIGYLCETKEHYTVEYHGIKKGLEDLGIDLIAKKKNETLIIQCKYWSTKKEIHENHICQLYGTSIKYQLEHPNENVIPVFVCHNELSEIAKTFAQKLGIEIHENIELGEYPAIKCNPDSMIYHLPFDLSYDNTENCIKVMTVEEAENLGYRRSYKWHGNL